MPLRVAGAVLAGGASRRMGADKALLVVEGRPLLRRTLDVLVACGVDPVAQAGGPARDPVLVGEVLVLDDRHPGAGPLAGLEAALTWSPHPWLAVLACDLPGLTPSDLAPVLDVCHQAGPDVDVVVADSGRLEPLCSVWRVETSLPVVRSALNARAHAVVGVLDDLAVRAVRVRPDALRNLNAPSDLDGR